MRILSPDVFREESLKRDYAIFENYRRPFNLNIVGWRKSTTLLDQFGDQLGVYWKESETYWNYRLYPITTRPGKPWLLNPMSKKGTAILAPGQYNSVYKLGTYKGYTALKQTKEMTVFRDVNRDLSWDSTNPETGLFGIHIHRAGLMSKLVGLSSAGCQVFQNRKHYEDFIDLCVTAMGYWGNNFTYTLMEI